MTEEIGLKLLSIKIIDCTSEGELKSVLKEVTTRTDPEENVKAVVASIKAQLCYSVEKKPSTEEINNVLTFIKSLAETQPQFGIGTQKFDELLKNDSASTHGAVKLSSPSSSTNDFLYEFVIEPLLSPLWDYVNLIINDYCKTCIQNLTSTKGPTTLSTHELLSLIHKLVRTTLTLLKRIDLANEHVVTVNPELKTRLITFGESLCDLLQESNFELSLDIKCNIGLSLRYIINILEIHESDSTSFFESLFIKNQESEKLKIQNGIHRRILEVSLDDLSRIALAFGVLGTMSIKHSGFKPIMLAIGENILNIDHGTKEATNLGSARVLEIWTDKLSHAGMEILKEFTSLFVDLEFFIFSYLPGHIDAVKTCSRYILGSLTRIYDRMDGADSSKLVLQLLEKVMVKPMHIKWIGISCISRNTLKAVDILKTESNLPEILLCCQQSSTNPCNDSYLSLMSQQFSKVDESEWEKNWVDPLFKNQVQIIESNWPQKRDIMTSILKSRNEAIKEAILRSVLSRMNSNVTLCSESSLLAVEAVKIAADLEIKMYRSINDITTNDTNSFRGIIPRDRLHIWLITGNPQIRLAGFSLLVETKKTSEIIPLADFESLKLLFKYSFVSQSPAFRQQFLSYFKKLLKRLKDSQRLVVRNRDTKNIKHYEDFMHWLWKFLTADEGLFPGSNFGRRCQALECLSELTNQFDMNTLGVNPCQQNLSYIQWLHDTYEYNKAKALQILSKLPMPDLVDSDSEKASEILSQAFELCESVKPPDSLTGRYLIVLLMKKCHSIDEDRYAPWSLLSIIFDKLKCIYDKVVESTLIEVAAETPMYGHIRSIRMIFTETKEFLKHWEKYSNYCSNLINLCLKLDDILFPILGSAAPEGWLPGLPDSQPENSKVVRSINAQMLLVCSWRSMKDVCLLLTEMCVLFPLEGETENYILSYDQIVLIGEHLLYLLKNLMHRGVFEQVYIGFRQLAGRLFKSSSDKLNKLPEEWLNSAMDEELVNSKCITRRSAGLPFIFQALLSPVCSDEAFVGKFVTRLFSPDSTSSPLVRIHAMNVLRGLFRDANFSRAMMPYVPSGIELSFKGLKSLNWTERNSGLMLFGALIRRTFGPKLNLMSAPTFFRKFPQMYDFLLGEIRKCCFGLKNKGYLVVSDFTFHVLLLLSSFSANGIVEDKHFRLVEFIPLIRECGSSADSQVRTIAAKALVPFLINPADKIAIIMTILKDLTSNGIQSTNKVHGYLVQVRTVLATISSDASSRNDIIVQFNDFITQFFVWRSRCPIIFEVLLDICMELGEKTTISYKVIEQMIEEIFGNTIINRRAVPGLQFMDVRLAAAEIFFVLADDRTANILETIYNWMQCRDIVFVEQLLCYLCKQIVNSVRRSTDEWSLVLDSIVKRYVKENFELYCESTVEERFLGVIVKISVEAFSDWGKFVDKTDFLRLFERLLFICESDGGTIESKGFALMIMGNMSLKIEHTYLEIDHIEKFCDLLTHFCDSKFDDDIRLSVAKCIPKFPFRKLNLFSVLQQMKIWYVVFILAQDDDSPVRLDIGRKINQDNVEVCERRTLECLLNLFFEEFASIHVLEGLVILLGLLLRDDFEIRVLEADDGQEDRLFDKSEMNSFNEPVILAKILLDVLENFPVIRNHMTQHFLNSHLNNDLHDFFVFVSNSTLRPGPERELLTLQALCEIVPMKLTSCVDVPSSNCVPQSSEKHFVQKWVRKFVLSVFS